MTVKLKPLAEQVILITGASSGIGLLTAQTAAEMGANVILIARNAETLDNAAADINAKGGGRAIAAAADVADPAAYRAAVERGVAQFGRVDTWVNDAGTGMFGRLTETDIADDRRLFETNFWGIVNGSRLAVEYLRSTGGALVNVGSVVSTVAIPPQGMYSASKHAVLGFTNALRIELANAGVPISVTLIRPAAIDTPFAKHAKNYFQKEPSLPPPVYDPHLVASAILYAAEHPKRELFVGGGGKLMSIFQKDLPSLMDSVLGTNAMWSKNFTDRPAQDRDGALHAPSSETGNPRGGIDRDRMIRQHSAYNAVAQHPLLSAGVLTVALGALAAYLLIDHEEKPATWTDRLGRAREDATDRVAGAVADGSSYVSDTASHWGRDASRWAHRASDAVTDVASDWTRSATGLAGSVARRASAWW